MFSHAASAADPRAAAPAGRPLSPLTILFGSQTGSSESLAKRAAKEAGKRGFAATVMDMAQFDLAKLAAEKNLLVITSTYGEGDPPDNAKALHAALRDSPDMPLSGLRFSVCALGDRNYNQFCRCGQDFDSFLERLGAKRAAPRVDCDVDYEEPYTKWLDAALGAIGQRAAIPAPAPGQGAQLEVQNSQPEPETGFSKKNPFPAPVIAVRRLSSADSEKDVNHVEFSWKVRASSMKPAMPSACGRRIVPNWWMPCSPRFIAMARRPWPHPPVNCRSASPS